MSTDKLHTSFEIGITNEASLMRDSFSGGPPRPIEPISLIPKAYYHTPHSVLAGAVAYCGNRKPVTT